MFIKQSGLREERSPRWSSDTRVRKMLGAHVETVLLSRKVEHVKGSLIITMIIEKRATPILCI